MHLTVLHVLNISPKPNGLPPYLQQTGPAETASSTRTPETSFWLPGAFLSSIPHYIYCSGWRSEGMPGEVGRSNCTHISHCVSEQLPGPIRNAERSKKQEETGWSCCSFKLLLIKKNSKSMQKLLVLMSLSEQIWPSSYQCHSFLSSPPFTSN